MKLIPFDFSSDNIEIRFHYVSSPPADYSYQILVVSFKGICPAGCEGNEDAEAMYAMGMAGIIASNARGVIIDCTELEYVWGDQFEGVLNIRPRNQDESCSAIIVGPKCIHAIGTLLEGFEEPETKLLQRDNVFETIEEGVKYLLEDCFKSKDKAFAKAVSGGNINLITNMIGEGQDVNARSGTFRETPLCSAKEIKTVRLLVEAGADVNAQDDIGCTPLHQQQNVEIAKYLIECGADPDARNHSHYSPLTFAESIELAKLLVEAGADVQQRSRYTLLHSRNTLQHPDLVEYYIAKGLNVNSISEKSKTPMDIIDDWFEDYRNPKNMHIDGEKLFESYSASYKILERAGGIKYEDL